MRVEIPDIRRSCFFLSRSSYHASQAKRTGVVTCPRIDRNYGKSDALQAPGAVAELVDAGVELVEDAEEQVARGYRAARDGDVLVALYLPRGATDQHVRYVVVQVLIGVAHVRPVQDQRAIQQR